MRAVVFALLLALAAASGLQTVGDISLFELRGKLGAKDVPRFPSTRVILNGGEFEALSRVDGTFVFHGVPVGVYTLEVLSASHHFSQVKVKVEQDSIKALEYKYPGAQKEQTRYPLFLEAHGRVGYFVPREPFNPLSLIMTPMAIPVLISVVMIFVMPKMMDGMDEQQKKEMQEQMKGNDPQAMLSNMFGGGGKQAEDSDDD